MESGQIPLLTDQTMVLAPGLRLLTLVFGSLMFPKTIAELEDQTPVPEEGISAFKTLIVLQTEVSIPAFAADGGLRLTMVSESLVGKQFPVVTVQINRFVPDPNPLTLEIGDVGSSKTPEPETNVHKPDPGVGSVAFNETVSLLQILISNPALA